MRTYEWNKKYEIGFEPLDDQHKYILTLINKLLIYHSREREMIMMLLEELKFYVAFHFKSEENYMMLHDYEEFESHKREHMILMREMKEKIAEFRKGTYPLKKLVVFLIKSSITHTLEVDRIVGQYLKKITV